MPDVDLTMTPKLTADDLRLLWVNDWYDGPLEAVVEHEGERLLMVRSGEGPVDLEQPMQWALFRLSPAAWSEEEQWHALFEEHVGLHWCFHGDLPPEPAEARDPARFFERHARRAQRALGPALGWVDRMPER